MDYYPAIKTNGIFPFAVTWMDLEGIMLSKVSQRKTNTMFQLYVGSKKQNKWPKNKKQKSRNRPVNAGNKMIVDRAKAEKGIVKIGEGELGEKYVTGWKVQHRESNES